MTRVVAIIQARMGSTRFPGKVLADLGGTPMLAHVVRRVSECRLVDEVVVATSDDARDDPVDAYARGLGAKVFRGSESDVLDRYVSAASEHDAEVVVRVTADCPVIDAAVIDHVIGAFGAAGVDYATNTFEDDYPNGMDVEVFSRALLDRAGREARQPSEREHVTPWMRNSGRVTKLQVSPDPPLTPSQTRIRLTVDRPADLERLRALVRLAPSGAAADLGELLEVATSRPELFDPETVDGFRNEGYFKSLLEDEPIAASASHVTPTFLERANGSHVWDVDGNEYLDYSMGLGAVILGHAYPRVTEAAIAQERLGTTFSQHHRLEVDVAEALVEMIPCAEMVRFTKSGSDAASDATAAARSITGRRLIATCGYAPSDRELTKTFRYNDIASLERLFEEHGDDIACVVMEPVGIDEPTPNFLESVADLTRSQEALLVFDETVTGFRFAPGGAQELFGIAPDLACFGEAIANGYPISAVVGRAEIMAEFDNILSSPVGCDAVSLAAAKATIAELRAEPVLAHIWSYGERLRDGLNTMAAELGLAETVRCHGFPPRTVVTFCDDTGAASLLLESLFRQECVKRGLLFTGAHTISYSHSPSDVDRTLHIYASALLQLRSFLASGRPADHVDGSLIEPVHGPP
jgi:glutamate-1-semialdehyde 2,1-aminomutase/spore coat polysaccharide biosynthesis protein SpsF